MEEAQPEAAPALNKPPIKRFRGIRLDPALDDAIADLLDRLKTEKGHKETLSAFCRRAARRLYNEEVALYNADHKGD